MSSEISTVLVTGASGFVGSHIVKSLLESGLKVRGTVRTLRNTNAVDTMLKSLHPDLKPMLELTEADLLDSSCWRSAVKDCSHVVHSASPFPFVSPDCEDDVIKPAVDGTLNVLQACTDEGVKRVVYTSSLAAVYNLSLLDSDPGHVYTESDWNSDSLPVSTYIKSKTLAEKRAWQYVERLSEERRFEFVVLNPGFVFGPVFGDGKSATIEYIAQLLRNKVKMIPRVKLPSIDVRDLAEAHLQALTSQKAVGHRHMLVTQVIWYDEIARILQSEFKRLGYHVTTRVAPSVLIRIIAMFDKNSQDVVPFLDKNPSFNYERMRNVFNIKFMNILDSTLEMAQSLVKYNVVSAEK